MAIGRMQMNRQLYAEGTGILQASQAKDMLQRVAPRGEFLAYINPEEAGILRALGGAGEDINGTGIPSFFVKKAFKSVTKAVKKIASSPIGQIALAVAAPYAIGAFAPGFATLGGTGAFGAALRGGISNIGISALTGQKINPRNVLASAALSGGLQGLQTGFGRAPQAGDLSYTDYNDEMIRGSQAGVTPIGGGTNIDQFGSIQDYLAQTDPSKLTPAQRASEIAQQAGKTLSERTGSAGTMDLLKSVVSPDSTLIERGQAVKDLGSKALDSVFYKTAKDGTRELDKTAVLATLSAIPSYLDAKKAADEAGIEGFDEAAYNAERDKYMERYKTNLPASSFGIQAAANGGRIGYGDGTKPSAEENTPSQEIINRRIAQIKDMSKRGADIDTIKSITGASDQMIKDVLGQANGGRIGYREGTPREGIVSLTDEDSGVIYRDPKTGEPLTTTEFLRRAQEDEDRDNVSLTDEESGVVYEDPKTGKPLTTEEFLRMSQEDEDKELNFGASSITLPKKKTFRERSMEIAVPKQINREMEDKFENYLRNLITGGKNERVEKELKEETPNAYPFMIGTSPVTYLRRYLKEKEMKSEGGRMGFMMGTEVPMRQNQGGITELDYRKTGGFVPVGVKERADDVPAMLSKNEFVFTADAVRGAGKGDINKGAKMMYAKMKALEGKVKKFKKTKKKKVKV
jgi:hypothetical protein